MFNYVDLSIAFFIALVASLLLTIPVKKLAVKIGAVDFPQKRKIHKVVTPRLGGLAIFAGFVLALIYIHPRHEYLPAILLGGIIILITGAIDDKYTITPIAKLTGQLIAASFLVNAGLIIERFTVPFIGTIELG
ncbi:undecaprenyl-phosphate alpha-N-acetylglucosaminyl 1-phosphate transferase, partial [Oceanobacillus caeni]